MHIIHDPEPSWADLARIEREMPAIQAEILLLDAEIAVLDRAPSELDRQRLRRAHNRVLTERRALANSAARQVGGAA
ncbi:DUF6284 family protein [Streptomyces sp. SID11385]|uniref:DUF6284 family protein n=1 Tax=Streptomyces sp. SID11385 TaxID=2706031 RepID=UPI0013C77C11|nr:DUF6284 family protein [Streptomyces sp. SID11385]NEA40655.1 hypothetical protein [Streptomyces sp. SID11385]